MRERSRVKGRRLSASSKERAEGERLPQSRTDADSRATGIAGFGQRRGDTPVNEASAPDDPLNLEDVLQSVRETAYRWHFPSDRIVWADNAAAVLGVANQSHLNQGRAFALLVDPEHAGRRYDTITEGGAAAPEAETRYCLRYRLLPEGRRAQAAVWVEDCGICSFDADARALTAQGTLRVIDDRRDREERLLYLSSHDELTGQLNRTRLTEELSNLLFDVGRGPRKGAFLLAAVNDLTLINETYGYDVGDEVIAIVGRRLARALRGRDCLGRFSSNKFGVILPECDKTGAEAIARRVMAAVRDNVLDTSVGAVAVTISVGAVLLPDHAATAQATIGRALQTLDGARNDRNDPFAFYRPCERRESERRRTVGIADEIVRALNDRRLMLALQPIVTSRSREPELYECLLRLRRLDGSIAAAADFIPVAEQFGLAKLVDHRALELAAEILRTNPTIKLALNVSAATATDPQWLTSLEAFTGKDRSQTERLTVEITETAAISDLEETSRFVGALKALGCRVALDDFGAGYTSFRNLKMLGVDMVKIDGSFIQNLGAHAEDEMFVRALIDLAHNFDVTTVGEWVTDERTAKLLENAGIAYMQGYFFGAPELAKETPLSTPQAR